jgi:hypothetical protein
MHGKLLPFTRSLVSSPLMHAFTYFTYTHFLLLSFTPLSWHNVYLFTVLEANSFHLISSLSAAAAALSLSIAIIIISQMAIHFKV